MARRCISSRCARWRNQPRACWSATALPAQTLAVLFLTRRTSASSRQQPIGWAWIPNASLLISTSTATHRQVRFRWRWKLLSSRASSKRATWCCWLRWARDSRLARRCCGGGSRSGSWLLASSPNAAQPATAPNLDFEFCENSTFAPLSSLVPACSSPALGGCFRDREVVLRQNTVLRRHAKESAHAFDTFLVQRVVDVRAQIGMDGLLRNRQAPRPFVHERIDVAHSVITRLNEIFSHVFIDEPVARRRGSAPYGRHEG